MRGDVPTPCCAAPRARYFSHIAVPQRRTAGELLLGNACVVCVCVCVCVLGLRLRQMADRPSLVEGPAGDHAGAASPVAGAGADATSEGAGTLVETEGPSDGEGPTHGAVHAAASEGGEEGAAEGAGPGPGASPHQYDTLEDVSWGVTSAERCV